MGEEEKVPVKIQAAIEQGQVRELYLLFSTDGGTNWFEVQMEPAENGYSVEIPNVNVGTQIMYCFKALDNHDNEIIEDNEGEYYTEIATAPKPPVKKIGEQHPSSKKPQLGVPQAPFPKTKSAENESVIRGPSKPEVPTFEKPKFEKPKLDVPNFRAPKIDIPLGTQQKIDVPPISSPQNKESKKGPAEEKPFGEEKEPPKIQPPRLKKPKIHPPKVVKHGKISDASQAPDTSSDGAKMPPEFQQADSGVFDESQKSKRPAPMDSGDSEKTLRAIAPPIEEIFKEDNPELPQPIVASNPFSLDAGNVTGISQPMQSFSQIIRFKPAAKPESGQGKGKIAGKMVRQCTKCQAILAKKWKICAVCGEKA